jgi:nitrate/nitrite transporter NarK
LFYFLLGVSFTAFSLALMEVKEFCPVKMTGTAVGIISAVGFLGSAVFIQLVGQFLETSSSRSEDIFNSIRSFFMLNVFVMGVVLVGLILYEVVEAWRSAKSDRLKI